MNPRISKLDSRVDMRRRNSRAIHTINPHPNKSAPRLATDRSGPPTPERAEAACDLTGGTSNLAASTG